MSPPSFFDNPNPQRLVLRKNKHKSKYLGADVYLCMHILHRDCTDINTWKTFLIKALFSLNQCCF